MQKAFCPGETERSRRSSLGSVNGSIRKPGADQVALTPGPLVLSHCPDSPRHGEPVEIISAGVLTARSESESGGKILQPPDLPDQRSGSIPG